MLFIRDLPHFLCFCYCFFILFYEKPKRKMINDLLKLRFHVLFKKVCSGKLCGILLRGSFIKLIGKIYFLCRCLYFNAGAAVCGSLFLYGGPFLQGVWQPLKGCQVTYSRGPTEDSKGGALRNP